MVCLWKADFCDERLQFESSRMRLNAVKYKNFMEAEQEQRSETLLGKQQEQHFCTRCFCQCLKINHVADVETETVNFTDSLLHFDSLQTDHFRTVSLLKFYSSLT